MIQHEIYEYKRAPTTTSLVASPTSRGAPPYASPPSVAPPTSPMRPPSPCIAAAPLSPPSCSTASHWTRRSGRAGGLADWTRSKAEGNAIGRGA